MLATNFRTLSTAPRLATDVCIVGAGPVGLVLSRMLTKFGVSNAVIERFASHQDHPKAHYLSFRTCEILQDLLDDPFLDQQIERHREWNRFLYCSTIQGELPFAAVTHFTEKDVPSWSQFSYANPSHYSQNRLVDKLKLAEVKHNLAYCGHTQSVDGVTVQTEEGTQIDCQVLVGCDGVRSKVRRDIGSQMQGQHGK